MRAGEPDLSAWDNVDTATHIQRQRHYLSLPKLYESWGIPRKFVSIDSSQSPMSVAIDALKAINPHLASVENEQRGDRARQQLLLDELRKYHDEGNMEDAELRWRRQINLEAELGGGKEKRR